MALLLCDSFDALGVGSGTSDQSNTMKWTSFSAAVGVGRRPGGKALVSQYDVQKYLDPTVSDWAMGFAYYWPGGAYPWFALASGYIGGYVTPHKDWQMSVDVNGKLYIQEITLQSGSWLPATTNITANASMVANAWNYVELKQVGATGYLRVNGNTVGTGTIASEAQVGFGLYASVPYGAHKIDDFYLLSIDAETPDWLGDTAIIVLEPVEDESVEWTPLTGSDNYAMVDEAPADEDVTYNHTDAVEKTDLFIIDQSAALDPAFDVFGVQLCVRGEKVNTASIDLQPIVQSGEEEQEGPRWGLGTGYGTFVLPMASDPQISGGQPWTVESLLAAYYGYRSKQPTG